MKNLTIEEPSLFFSYRDEEHFFTWLESISAVQNVTRSARGLDLKLSHEVDDASLLDLIALLTRYGLDRKCLRKLSTAKNQHWFKKSKKYWYRAVFK